MLDIKFIRENPELVKENIKKKFKDHKLPLVDEVLRLDEEKRATNSRANELRALRNKVSKEIGALMGQGKREEAEEKKAIVTAQAKELSELEAKENELAAALKENMMKIPNIIDESVPIGKDDSENVVVIEFSLKSDLEIMYRELSKGISQNEKIDLSGNILAYGTEKAVKTALK